MGPEARRITLSEAEAGIQPERVADRHVARIHSQHPELIDFEEVGTVLLPSEASRKPQKPRAEENVIGQEVVRQSSKSPVILRPSLEASRQELAQARADTHTRVEHEVSNVIALGTGFVSGIIDGLANGVAEIAEDLVFGVSKTAHNTKHGWERGKTQVRGN